MRTPWIDTTQVKRAKPKDWAVRFAFGGAISVIAALLGRHFGLELGGLFLAFPAILPASLTLAAKHDGRKEAAEDSIGACCGSFALALFAVCVWRASGRVAFPLVLAIATGVWLACSVLLWLVTGALRRR